MKITIELTDTEFADLTCVVSYVKHARDRYYSTDSDFSLGYEDLDDIYKFLDMVVESASKDEK